MLSWFAILLLNLISMTMNHRRDYLRAHAVLGGVLSGFEVQLGVWFI
jgi:hypothetical protein